MCKCGFFPYEMQAFGLRLSSCIFHKIQTPKRVEKQCLNV